MWWRVEERRAKGEGEREVIDLLDSLALNAGGVEGVCDGVEVVEVGLRALVLAEAPLRHPHLVSGHNRVNKRRVVNQLRVRGKGRRKARIGRGKGKRKRGGGTEEDRERGEVEEGGTSYRGLLLLRKLLKEDDEDAGDDLVRHVAVLVVKYEVKRCT